jgi:hypothetical protein
MLASDSDSDGEAGDLAADGDWEEFDAMPAQTVDVRGASPAFARRLLLPRVLAPEARASLEHAGAARFW